MSLYPEQEAVVVYNDAEILPTTLKVMCNRVHGDLEAVRIEMYADEACQVLIYDDIQYDTLPQHSRVLIDAAVKVHMYGKSKSPTLDPVSYVMNDFFARISRR